MSATAPPAIQHTEADEIGLFSMEKDGKLVGSMSYRRVGPTEIVIEHTEVHEVMRGLGVARKLLDALAIWARSTNTTVSATCLYVLGQFERESSFADIQRRR